MTGHDVVFILVALVTAGAAIKTVVSTNLVHAALYLAVTLAGIAGVFLVLHADFLALVQLVVYVGAVTVLFLFGLMLTRAPIGREALDSQNRGLAIAVSGTLFVVLSTLVIMAFGDVRATEVAGAPVADIGLAIFSTWVLPFEVLSMLLLAALIGAIVLARREDGESGTDAAPTHIELGDAPPSEHDRRDGDDRPATRADHRRPERGAWGGRPMSLVGPLLLATFLFCLGIYGLIARRNAVLVLISVELMLNAVNINLVAFQNLLFPEQAVDGQIFVLFIIAVAAAEVGVGLAIVFNLFRNRASVDVDDVDLMRW